MSATRAELAYHRLLRIALHVHVPWLTEATKNAICPFFGDGVGRAADTGIAGVVVGMRVVSASTTLDFLSSRALRIAMHVCVQARARKHTYRHTRTQHTMHVSRCAEQLRDGQNNCRMTAEQLQNNWEIARTQWPAGQSPSSSVMTVKFSRHLVNPASLRTADSMGKSSIRFVRAVPVSEVKLA